MEVLEKHQEQSIKPTRQEFVFQGDSLFYIVDWEKKWRLDFSVGMIDTGVMYAKIDHMITTNFIHSQFENAWEVEKYYQRYIQSLVLGEAHLKDLWYTMVVELIRHIKNKWCRRVFLEPDSTQKQVYWKDKIWRRLQNEGIIKKYWWREEIGFEL